MPIVGVQVHGTLRVVKFSASVRLIIELLLRQVFTANLRKSSPMFEKLLNPIRLDVVVS